MSTRNTTNAALQGMLQSLKAAQERLALLDSREKDAALQKAATAVAAAAREILEANKKDVEAARADGMKESLVDRLQLNPARIQSISAGINKVALLTDPVGRVSAGWKTQAGLFIEKVAVPLGVVAIIYESRPNVTAEAFSLAYKSGNAILLRGSRAALETNRSLVTAIKRGLAEGGIAGGIPEALELFDSSSRDDIDKILTARGWIDAVIPRGGAGLIRHVVDNARIPVIETGEGNCHIYVEPTANIEEALKIIVNAKLQRPGVCNAVETLLVHKDVAAALLPLVARAFASRCELRCDKESRDKLGPLPAGLVVVDATNEDWAKEFLDTTLAIKTVSSLDEAVNHINRYGTSHSEAILTNDLSSAEAFCRRVDAACVYVNASTRFTDGEMYGFGAELGISTQKFHTRGPMGLEALTSIKYRVTGSGHTRD